MGGVQRIWRWLAAVWVLVSCLDARAYDFNRTLIHYWLTSSQNVLLELERTRSLIAILTAEPPEPVQDAATTKEGPAQEAARKPDGGAAPGATAQPGAQEAIVPVSALHLVFGRFDYLVPKKKDDHTWMYGMVGYQSRDFLPFEGARMRFTFGVTVFDIRERTGEDDFDSIATFINFLGGFEGGYRNFFALETNVSGNALHLKESPEKKKTYWDFDQAAIRASVPFLGPYGVLKYDLGDARPRDIELGWSGGFGRWGILTVAYAARFAYPVTGIAIRDDLDPANRFTIRGDHSAVIRWSRVAPLWPWLHASLDLALGNVPDVVRLWNLGLTVFVRGRLGVFARGGTAYSRLDRALSGRSRYWGASGGLEGDAYLFYYRVGFGWRDPDVVDRLGDVGRVTLSGTVFLAF